MKTIYKNIIFAGFAIMISNLHSQTIIDIDGNIYNTVTIGTQVWFLENLKVTHYTNGLAIPNITDNLQWENQTTGAYCNYNNDSNYVSTYGRLYNYYAVVDTSNLCPIESHVPSFSEFITMKNYLGLDAGGALKETGTIHWKTPNTGATNSSGFTGLPGGWRVNIDNFDNLTENGYFYSSTESDSANANAMHLKYDLAGWGGQLAYKYYGFSVRCLLNSGSGIENIIKEEYKVYPNPTYNGIFFEFNTKQDYEIQIFNLMGNLLRRVDLCDSKNYIDISDFAGGFYFYRVIAKNLTGQGKLIKE